MRPVKLPQKRLHTAYLAAIVGCIFFSCIGCVVLLRLTKNDPPNLSETHTAVAVQISGLIREFSTATAAARLQATTPTTTPHPTSTATPAPAAASTSPPQPIDWEILPFIGYIIINMRALAGGGNELVVGLTTLLLTQLKRIIKLISTGSCKLSLSSAATTRITTLNVIIWNG